MCASVCKVCTINTVESINYSIQSFHTFTFYTIHPVYSVVYRATMLINSTMVYAVINTKSSCLMCFVMIVANRRITRCVHDYGISGHAG